MASVWHCTDPDVRGMRGVPQARRSLSVVAVTSGKGGVGKTTASINLALDLAARGRRVVLLDADLGLANVDVMLGLKPQYNLGHVVEGSCELRDVIVRGPAGIRIVPGASGIRRMAELGAAERAGLIYAFSELGAETDVLVIDTPAGIAGGVTDFCAAAQEVLVVVCNEPASLTDAYAVIKVLNQQTRRRRFRVLVNMVRGVEEGQALFRRLVAVATSFLDVSLDLAGIVPFDDSLRAGVLGKRAQWAQPRPGPAARAFKKLAERADNWPTAGHASGGIEFFVERLVGSTQKVAVQL